MTRLDALPLELLFHIFSYTEPICCLSLTRYPLRAPAKYPLNALAASNRRLRDAVEAYARGLLVREAGLDRSKKTGPLVSRRKWLRDLCYFCKKSSKRKACFYPLLTCCSACDKKEFVKMTMTEARDTTLLSKLDLFTPSPLHLDLPPLATGLHMGGVATMISTPDVLARRAYIGSLLGDEANDDAFMRRRQARHDRIMKHLNIDYIEGGGWVMRGGARSEPVTGAVPKKLPKSMQTMEDRMRYAEEGLRGEWKALGLEENMDLADMWRCLRRGGRKREDAVLETYGGGESIESPIEID